MEDRLDILKLACSQAIQDFDSSLDLDLSGLSPEMADLAQNGQIQKFEFTVEILWKTIKEFLNRIHGFDLASPKLVIKKHFELGYINTEELELLLQALDIRNSLSHIYNKALFMQSYDRVVSYRGFFSPILQRLASI